MKTARDKRKMIPKPSKRMLHVACAAIASRTGISKRAVAHAAKSDVLLGILLIEIAMLVKEVWFLRISTIALAAIVINQNFL